MLFCGKDKSKTFLYLGSIFSEQWAIFRVNVMLLAPKLHEIL